MAKKKKTTAEFDGIFVDKAEYGEKLEGFGRLKDNILFLIENGKNKIVQVESSVAGECKTTVIANLAVLLGMNEKKVLIIDIDFLRAKSHILFNVNNEKGLNEYMLGQAALDEVVQSTQYKNVDLLPRGGKVANASLVLISEKFHDTLKKFREEYDIVLIDMSPVLQSANYLHVSPLTDATLFLVAYGKTHRSQVREAIAELKKSGANIVGAVYTMYDPKIGRSVGYKGNSYYDIFNS